MASGGVLPTDQQLYCSKLIGYPKQAQSPVYHGSHRQHMPQLRRLFLIARPPALQACCRTANLREDPKHHTIMQVLAISRYDGRGTISLQDSVKSQHILPFFSNFVAWARRLETLLVGTDAEAEGVAGLSSCTVSSRLWAL